MKGQKLLSWLGYLSIILLVLHLFSHGLGSLIIFKPYTNELTQATSMMFDIVVIPFFLLLISVCFHFAKEKF